MDLKTYMKHLRESVDLFEKNWKEQNLQRPHEYPMELPSGADWEEQFHCWSESQPID